MTRTAFFTLPLGEEVEIAHGKSTEYARPAITAKHLCWTEEETEHALSLIFRAAKAAGIDPVRLANSALLEVH